MGKQVNWDLEREAFYQQFGFNIASLDANQINELDLAVERACWEIDGYRNRNGEVVEPTDFGTKDPAGCVAAYIGSQLEELEVKA